MDEFGNEVCPALFRLVSMLQAAGSDIHLDVRQFGAIDLYHYHEERCFVPQLNVSGPVRRKSVGRSLPIEIPDGDAKLHRPKEIGENNGDRKKKRILYLNE
ncbi:hypothetical protein X777_05184 [Ooceraea biroi]|uniref:Uncharacterized protein n=1 Tax=Ooceraea biroi TaxID=2015173 RepID=A0A026WJF3_OOCBI|nr:hypothetical protein X777_05184 [Ooceraea biroi]